MKKTLLILMFLSFLSNSCKEKNNSEINEKEKIETIELNTKSSENKVLIDSFRVLKDSVIIPEFAIKINLSEKAKAKLKKDNESTIVQAYFTGIPKDTLDSDYQKWGEKNIGQHRIELWDSKIAHFKNVKISKKALEDLSDTNFEVLINVFSGRHSTDSNILDCGVLQASIDKVKGKTHLINGKLLFGE
ncbi:hypothetical protein [Bizionia sp. M204]|uniref:hypothetical protein n=1 Tax=Bizionia sp. M204 TaxID=2675331 RepID=UPI00206336B1|nr:hypothetical protein [Bizionia sp. M204]UPS92781.1 hypothetical protein GMA17_14080 [Bizionia sp. M204]